MNVKRRCNFGCMQTHFSRMDLIDRLKQTFSPAEEEVMPAPLVDVTPVVGTPVVDPAAPVDPMTTNSSTWTTFVESMDSARKRASVIFTIPDSSAEAGADPAAAGGPGFGSTVRDWWGEATAFMEETKISVEEKIAEMTGPSPIKNDPLGKLRSSLTTYTEALEQLRTEAFNLGMSAENMARLGSPGLARSIADTFGAGTVTDQFEVYRERQGKLVVPILDETRSGVETITAMVTDEITKIQSIQTRFKRRDRLHQSLVDMRARVEVKRGKNNRRVADGLPMDTKAMEETYELTRTMESIESDFRVTSEQLVSKCNDVMGRKSQQFHEILVKLVDTQNAFFYRVGGSCSIPFQELLEAMKADKPGLDDMEDLGSHALTWRSNADDKVSVKSSSNDDFVPMKVAPPRRATVSISKIDLENAKGADANLSPSSYAYRRDRAGSGTSPAAVRRAGTSTLLQ